MRSSLGDRARLQHILDAIIEIEQYTAGTDFNDFKANSMMRYACIKQLEIIGEAANHLTDTIKSNNNHIKWHQIIGMRNVFVHEYFGVDINVLWNIIEDFIPPLKSDIIIILK